MGHQIKMKDIAGDVYNYTLASSFGRNGNKRIEIQNTIDIDGSVFAEYVVRWEEGKDDLSYGTVDLKKAIERYNELP